MIIFTVPKPFIGEFKALQQNAIESWLKIKPKPTIVLFGNEKGTSCIAKKYNIFHVHRLKINKKGTPLLDSVFFQVQDLFKDKIYMYINTDIIISNFPQYILPKLKKHFSGFLAVGRRYEKINSVKMKMKGNSWMDYFIFTSDIFTIIPPFALGRTFWDKWFVWDALRRNIPVVDITNDLFAVHQSHTYRLNHKTNRQSVWAGNESMYNLQLAGGWAHGADVGSATHEMRRGNIYAKIRTATFFNVRRFLDLTPILWPLFLKVRLMRECLSSIMYK
jgi:hypothetical protein